HHSHRLQPLGVSCYSPLRTQYGREVHVNLMRVSVYHIDKEDFLSISTKLRPSVFSNQNIRSKFLATGLLLFNPQRVLLL
ncbi:hypothetical protein BCR34DRAFT_436145, partial [Clohesyomyces aquaticus]